MSLIIITRAYINNNPAVRLVNLHPGPNKHLHREHTTVVSIATWHVSVPSIQHSALGTTRQDTRVSFRIYQEINTMVPNLCKCVQQVHGLWKIYPVTSEARSRLLASGIMFKGKKIKLHDEDPFETDKIPSEKIIIRDLPIDVRDDDIISFLQEHCNKLTLRSPMIADKIRDNNNRVSDCLNGNRHIYVQSGFSTVLPEVAIIDEHRCRIYHEGPKEYSLHVVGLLLLQRSTNCTHSSCPRNGGPFLPFFGQAGQVDPLVGWRCCY